MSDTLKDIKSIALQMEMDGIKLYNDLAAKTLHPLGKAMFKSFVEDEKLHAKRLRALLSARKKTDQRESGDEKNPRERLITVFQKMGDEVKGKVNVNTNDIEAVKVALGMEENGIRFYEQAAKEANNSTKDKETFHFLTEEEKTHLSILKNTLGYLENTEMWGLENEGRIYDMWMNMVNKKT